LISIKSFWVVAVDLKVICQTHKDFEAKNLLDQVIQNPTGINQHTEGFDNIQTLPAPTGTSSSAALRRLRKDRPDLLDKAIAGGITPNSAIIEAGFRYKNYTILVHIHSTSKAIRKNIQL
jgi:hypothetical protein